MPVPLLPGPEGLPVLAASVTVLSYGLGNPEGNVSSIASLRTQTRYERQPPRSTTDSVFASCSLKGYDCFVFLLLALSPSFGRFFLYSERRGRFCPRRGKTACRSRPSAELAR